MSRKLLPLLLATVLCILPPTASGRQLAAAGAMAAAQASAAVADEPASLGQELTEAEREAFQLAQQSSDPGLGEQRGGWVGLVLVILLVILIVAIVD